MFDIGWAELLIVGVVALIVVGPKDLPRMFAALGRFTGKARGMAREFQRAMDDAAKETGVAETAKDLRDMTSKKNLGLDRIEEAAKKFETWDPVKSGRAKPSADASPGSETAKLAEKKAAEAEGRRAAKAEAPAAGTAAKATPKPKAAPKTKAASKAKPASKPKAAAKPKAKTGNT